MSPTGPKNQSLVWRGGRVILIITLGGFTYVHMKIGIRIRKKRDSATFRNSWFPNFIPDVDKYFRRGSPNLSRATKKLTVEDEEGSAKGRVQKPQARKLSVGGVPPPQGLHGQDFSEKLAEKS